MAVKRPVAQEFVIATGNDHKAGEIERAVSGRMRLIRPTRKLPEVDETGHSLRENALLKARSAVHELGLPALADDTALEIDALDGRPGLYTARFARSVGSYSDAARVLLRHLERTNSAKKTARFRTVAVAVLTDGTAFAASGVLEGRIADEPVGEGGFGFDPIFEPNGTDGRTLAQLTADESIAISHRATAFRTLVDVLAKRGLTRVSTCDGKTGGGRSVSEG